MQQERHTSQLHRITRRLHSPHGQAQSDQLNSSSSGRHYAVNRNTTAFRRLALFPVSGFRSDEVELRSGGMQPSLAVVPAYVSTYTSAARGLLPLADSRTGSSPSLALNAPLWALVSLFAAFSLLWATTIGRIIDGEMAPPTLRLTAVVDQAMLAAEMLRTTAASFPQAQSVVLARLRLGQQGGDAPWTLVEVDGKALRASIDAAGVEAALAAAGFQLEAGDRVVALPNTGGFLVQRAIPFSVVDSGLPMAGKVAAGTVGEALQALGIDLQTADVVHPEADSPLVPGLRITVLRAYPVTIVGSNLQVELRSRAATIGELLAEADVLLGPLDRVEPAADEAVPAHGTVRVVRVREEEQIESRLIPFKTHTQFSNELAPGARYRLRTGVPGLIERLIEVVLEDDVEVRRTTTAETLVREVVDEIYVAGRSPLPRVSLPDLALPAVPLASGLPANLPVKRVMNMVATAYDPGPISTGKSPGHPAYGITATGMRATYGVVAVDPRVIPFYTRLYIPGYGYAVAADTGGAIIGNRIDLFYPTYHEAVQWGRRSVQVYILE